MILQKAIIKAGVNGTVFYKPDATRWRVDKRPWSLTHAQLMSEDWEPVLAKPVATLWESNESSESPVQKIIELMGNGSTQEEISAAIKQNNLGMTPMAQIDALVHCLVNNFPEKVQQYCDGKVSLFNWFVGQIMKDTNGRADPAYVTQALEFKLRPPQDDTFLDIIGEHANPPRNHE